MRGIQRRMLHIKYYRSVLVFPKSCYFELVLHHFQCSTGYEKVCRTFKIFMQNVKNLGRVNLKAYIYASHLITAVLLIAYMLYLLLLLINKCSLFRSTSLL
jgi:hypothetical protein